MKIFIRDKDRNDDGFVGGYELVQNENGYSLESVYSIIELEDDLQSHGIEYIVQDIEEYKILSPQTYALVQVLELLGETQSGDSDTPYIRSDTFNKLAKIMKEFQVP